MEGGGKEWRKDEHFNIYPGLRKATDRVTNSLTRVLVVVVDDVPSSRVSPRNYRWGEVCVVETTTS